MVSQPHFFRSQNRQISLPVFFPDATRAVVKTLDTQDIENTQTPGILVNTYHLYFNLGKKVLKKHGDIRGFMNWGGGVISDSGGFQVMSLVKSGQVKGKITDKGVVLYPSKKKRVIFTPEKSIEFQMLLNPDMVVVLDDFTPNNITEEKASETVRRTLDWAKRSKITFEKICQQKKIPPEKRPYLLAVVQGGQFPNLRRQCTQELVKIGFDGYGYGGWPLDENHQFDYQSAQIIKENTPSGALLYGLGIGKPEEIVNCARLGYHIFDCVLPTRDARHKRLYVYNADSIAEIELSDPNFYSFYTPDKEKYYLDTQPVSQACDCLLCRKYTRAYLAHLFRNQEITALRLATIHNLRFYSLLMEKLQKGTPLAPNPLHPPQKQITPGKSLATAL